MIKIISPWSHTGGSTIAYIDLCNLFNESGLDCTFYGPHDFHLDKCKSRKISYVLDANIKEDDHVIMHHILPIEKINCKKVILSCHEKHSFPIATKFNGVNNNYIDKVHFITEEQRKWHCIFPEESVIIGNYINLPFKINKSKNTNCAGVIGSIELRKRTFESVQKAIFDGFTSVKLYGNILDKDYFNFIMTAFGDKVKYMGYSNNKKLIYESVDKVYHLSRYEIACLVQGECKILGVPFEGSEFCPDYPIWTKDEILKKWKDTLEI
jgi:hypothetical protein